MQRATYTIDAADKSLGRLSAQIAGLLRGKHKPDFAPHKDAGDFVVVRHADRIRFSGKKLENKIYYHHSGYLGGMKRTALWQKLQKNPDWVLRKTVWGMLPKNKLRAEQIKRMKILKAEPR
ncbi:MAG: 50S ribosomal protein L13 [Candidatus Wildermuthbacteria bacterium RIFCSPHIGHO2_01_FULL_47_27]|uniref:Large ribosomal subunit protein uL13 n=2 Tax=Candidatus Wildermuthiibacteriota TaxID=1817923 RepID=A0A1G2RMJ8_9BACT|nr:MAG: 50S ribosomal protein L13 [Parcubacteria group bacterium GW2011_GWA2_47_9]OHA65090.1 MAG: 50S ribosomal protein L13 [Candidatus Wildermuthbacteria bacterium RIFCSPHIGHO2_01_FULL_47_27]OHA68047.1 MAG: 50S ribosomal protein L13 [Candidatus Wildermuthbacteria bacterium RIFCSPHIGHO2_02_FULL_47_17]OHA74046.1 MAG: 50S ribosomal protein L13 [Candidatus Wildermuthbacteria bacterium RIFCSPLOWO2_01_FULL_48_35]OHA75642.1 MAG: 50S ribosomal protein L13 [Candidatus Wildermuthbacteria bacterium RIFCS